MASEGTILLPQECITCLQSLFWSPLYLSNSRFFRPNSLLLDLCSEAVNSENMTHIAGNVRGRINGGKTATGTVPGGARAAAPPGWPGWGTSGGAMPGGGSTTVTNVTGTGRGCGNGCGCGIESNGTNKAALTKIPARAPPKIASPTGMQVVVLVVV